MKKRQLTETQLGPAPRPIPWSLRAYLGLLYGQIAIFFLGMGGAGFYGFALHADVKSLLYFLPTGNAQGVVTGLRDTKTSEGGGRHSRGTPIYALSYTYAMPGGPTRRGVSYSVGTWNVPSLDEDSGLGDDDNVVGRKVPVQYVTQFPSVSRIKGLRSNVFGLEGVFVSVFLAAGLFLTKGTLDLWRRLCSALSDGVQDPETGNLSYPDGGLGKPIRPPGRRRDKTLIDASVPAKPDTLALGDLMTGAPPVRDGLLQPPRFRSVVLVCILPTLTLLLLYASLRQHF